MKRSLSTTIIFFVIGFTCVLDAQQTSDGGYIIAGTTSSFTHGSTDFLVYKLDSKGIKQWRRNLGGTNEDKAYSIQQTSDGGYVVAGETRSYTHVSSASDCLIYKLNAAGIKQWRKNLGGDSWDWANDVQTTSDGGYIVAGFTDSYVHGTNNSDFLLYKLNAAGNKQWRKNYGGTGNDKAFSVWQNTDGGYVVAGQTYSYSHGQDDFLVYRLDAQGNKLWRKNMGGVSYETAYSVQQTSDGGFVVAGYNTSYNQSGIDSDFLAYKLYPNGSKEWRKNYGGWDIDWVHTVRQTSDNGYILAGTSRTFTNGDLDFFVVKTTPGGSVQWQKNFGGTYGDRAYFIGQTADGGYVVVGNTKSYVHGIVGNDQDFLVYKLDAAGKKQWRRNLGGINSDYVDVGH